MSGLLEKASNCLQVCCKPIDLLKASQQAAQLVSE